MNKTLEEIKQMAESQIECEYECQEIATHCLRLVKALEKCREQRDAYHRRTFYQFDSNTINAEIYGKQIEVDDQQLANSLEGKDE